MFLFGKKKKHPKKNENDLINHLPLRMQKAGDAHLAPSAFRMVNHSVML